MSLRAGSIKNTSSDDEKGHPESGSGVVEPYYPDAEDPLEQNEVFKKTHEGVNFRTVGWPRASVIFLKGTTSSHDISWSTQLTMLQSSSLPEFSVSQLPCTVWELSEELSL